MHTTAILSQKGGAGKTTLTLHLAALSAAAGHAAAVIDLDPQASSTKWADRREAELPVVISAHATRLEHEMKRVQDNGGERLFLDTAPHSDAVALSAARAADLVLIPCKPSILDIEAVTNTLDLVKATGTPHLVVMNAVPPFGSEAGDAVAFFAEQGIEVVAERLANRVAYARALAFGQTAAEFEPDGKAAAEVAALYTALFPDADTATPASEAIEEPAHA